MDKIASPSELLKELESLTLLVKSASTPSRAEIGAKLANLAVRLASSHADVSTSKGTPTVVGWYPDGIMFEVSHAEYLWADDKESATVWLNRVIDNCKKAITNLRTLKKER